MSAAGIAVQGLTHRYGGRIALDGVSLDLQAGATIAMVGPDGVGKSTLLGLIAGVRRLQQGTVRTLGVDMADRRRREAFLPRVAFMPQGLGKNLYPALSVFENIDFFGRLFALDAAARRARIGMLLEATGLAPFPDRPVGQLSGGMKQKVSLCCALVHDPDLLILDEPTTGVDPLSRRQFWVLVDQMRAARPGMTVIVSTAYMEEAERFSWLVAMNGGKVLASGPREDVERRTGTASVEAAYVALLPEAERAQVAAFSITPFADDGSPPVIEAADLTRRFGSFVAVDHVSFRIRRGEIFGFLGSNGCGKSTTMRMLTGLLEPSSGTVTLFGRAVTAGDMSTRMRIGYMSQGFSLYEELTVRQNLALQARLFRIPAARTAAAVGKSLADFELQDHPDDRPGDLPLGFRQRLQLACACINDPDILILDEPTSGVDPAARNMFWRHLARLSRDRKVTIFVSTHFMNEAERCDRISLMDHGKVLAMGTPAEITKAEGAKTLEDAFIACLERAGNAVRPAGIASAGLAPAATAPATPATPERRAAGALAVRAGRCWAFAHREGVELLRDRLRLAFALLGPVVLLLIAAYSISFDVNMVAFTVADRDGTRISRELAQEFRGSAWFRESAASADRAALDANLRANRAVLGIEIPPHFGRDLEAGRKPELAVVVDGTVPFLGANVRAYVDGVLAGYLTREAAALLPSSSLSGGLTVTPRFVYNQEFRSIYAMTPGIIMLALMLVPTMLTALGVVREKDIGSIVNFYASPAGSGQYLIGKQLPYVALAFVSYLVLTTLAVTVLGVPLKGSVAGFALAAALYLLATTGLGLLISTFVRSQVAAIFGTAIICLIAGVNFSGLLYPVSTLAGWSYYIGQGFPSAWFQLASLGSFTKGLPFARLLPPCAALAGFAAFYMTCAVLALPRQER